MNKITTLAIMITLFAGCEFLQPDVEDDFYFGPSYECSYTARSTYDILSDVSVDFDQTPVSSVTDVISSNCSGVSVGDTSSSSHDRMRRVSDIITLTDSGVDDSISVSGTSLGYPQATGCESGLYLRVTLSNGYLDTTNNDVVLELRVEVDYSYCSFYSYAVRHGSAVKRSSPLTNEALNFVTY